MGDNLVYLMTFSSTFAVIVVVIAVLFAFIVNETRKQNDIVLKRLKRMYEKYEEKNYCECSAMMGYMTIAFVVIVIGFMVALPGLLSYQPDFSFVIFGILLVIIIFVPVSRSPYRIRIEDDVLIIKSISKEEKRYEIRHIKGIKYYINYVGRSTAMYLCVIQSDSGRGDNYKIMFHDYNEMKALVCLAICINKGMLNHVSDMTKEDMKELMIESNCKEIDGILARTLRK